MRGVAVPDQEDLGTAGNERLIDLNGGADLFTTGSRAVGQIGFELARSASLRLPPLEVDPKVLKREGERRKRVGTDEAAGAPGVVLREGVGEAGALADHDVASPAQESSHGDADEHEDQRQMEDEVARLAPVPLLGSDPLPLGRAHPPMALAQLTRR